MDVKIMIPPIKIMIKSDIIDKLENLQIKIDKLKNHK